MPASAAKAASADPSEAKAPSGSQTLLRGLDLIDAVADRPIALAELASRLGLTRSTTHRLASALIDRRFLTFTPRQGYRLGPKLLELGFLAQQQADVVQIARDHIEALAAASEDTVHLGVRDHDRALYLDKIPGRRRVEISSRVGDRQPMTSTGLGKALMLDDPERQWQPHFEADQNTADYDLWLSRMRGYVGRGCAFDLEENEDQIRCVAAPIRDASGRIVAAISVSSAAQYMSDDRMTTLTDEVLGTAHAISRDLGWRDPAQG
ncbi:IclR family transcriptional regulator [uncultured Sphingomonas sp.]|uniref:IclR family transcriptional regulator n=1 Tax=uncultured Sphingomonas sp. TaxID=158754 RepID=UPI0025E17C11|nr:IclR family transcriptional regulator [uncultured Sphingomonas sp.]